MLDIADVSDGVNGQYSYFRNKDAAMEAVSRLSLDKVYALDFETTGLSPSRGQVRLTSISGHGERFIIDHRYCGLFEEDYANLLVKYTWAVFNACFEGRWFAAAVDFDTEISLLDVQFMRKAKLGGMPLSLAIMAKRDLNITLVKDQQDSNWITPELTVEQLDYAMHDADVTFELLQHWEAELTESEWRGFRVLNDAWRANIEMEETGFVLDIPYHRSLSIFWERKRETARRYFRKWTPEDIIENINSKKQVSRFLVSELDQETVKNWPKTNTGDLKQDRDTMRHAAHRLPYPMNRWLAALIIYNYYSKYTSTYGQKLIDIQEKMGRIYCRFNMAQAATGRYSSSGPNMQNIPRKAVVRRSFVSPKRGIVLVIADYSSIEVRVLAELSNDEALRHEAIYGDVHSRSASAIYKVPYEDFIVILKQEGHRLQAQFKDFRSRAKAFTFQLLYGAGAGALAIALRTTDEKAYAAIEAWARTFPRAYHYRTIMYEKMMHSGFLPVIDGRSIFIFKQDRTMPVAANYPVQGAAGSVMYRALYHLERNLRLRDVPARIVGSIHDEILCYAKEQVAKTTEQILSQSMTSGWLDIFPGTNTDNLLEPVIGTSWAAKK